MGSYDSKLCLSNSTAAQLAAAFMINLGFLMLHVQTNAFKTPSENRAQFNGLVSILLVLFSGIVLRFNELNKLYGDEGGDYDSMIISGILIASQVAVIARFLSKMLKPGKKANGMKRVQAKILDTATVAVMDRLSEDLDEILDEREAEILCMVALEQLSHETGDLALVLVTTCRETPIDDGGKKEEHVMKLSKAFDEQSEKIDMALFDLAVEICGPAGLRALHKVAIKQGGQLLEYASAPSLCIHMAVTAIKMGPRAMSSFAIVSSHLRSLATNCCPGEDVHEEILELILQIGGGPRGLQRIVDESFRLLQDDLLRQGVSKLGLCLLMPMSKAAVPSLFHELSNAEEDESSSDEEKEDKIDFCTLLLKMSGLTNMDSSGTSSGSASGDVSGNCFDDLVFLAKACLGTPTVDYLMEVECNKMARKACRGRSNKVCNAISGASKVACSTAKSHTRFALQLSSISANSSSQTLMDLASEQLTAKGLEEVTDPKLEQACDALMRKLDDEENFNTLDHALGEIIAENAGGIVVQHGLSVFCKWCALFQSAAGPLLNSKMPFERLWCREG